MSGKDTVVESTNLQRAYRFNQLEHSRLRGYVTHSMIALVWHSLSIFARQLTPVMWFCRITHTMCVNGACVKCWRKSNRRKHVVGILKNVTRSLFEKQMWFHPFCYMKGSYLLLVTIILFFVTEKMETIAELWPL